MINTFKIALKRVLRPIIYRFPPVMIWPHRLYIWLDVLSRTERLEGTVLEVGCYLGGTAAVSVRMLDAIESPRPYVVIDTFSGFEVNQFASEVRLGTSRKLAKEFASNSPSLTRWVLDRHGAKRVKILKGDISSMSSDSLPQSISACLLDVDLAEPIYEGLKKIYPLLVPGGIIAVDDCDLDTGYKAKLGYERFIAEAGLQPNYRYGMGLIENPF